jgi:hypothetical protein
MDLYIHFPIRLNGDNLTYIYSTSCVYSRRPPPLTELALQRLPRPICIEEVLGSQFNNSVLLTASLNKHALPRQMHAYKSVWGGGEYRAER